MLFIMECDFWVFEGEKIMISIKMIIIIIIIVPEFVVVILC